MRYSFHGKMRFTGQPVDGFIEARNSTEAIDRLADEGVIGVYTVRPDPIGAKPTLYVSGDPVPQASAPTDPAVAPMMDKLTSLIAQVEKMLARPVSYARGGDDKAPRRASSTRSKATEEQNSTLRAIFQHNLDLRQSIDKLVDATSALRPNDKPAARDANPSRTLNVAAQPAA